MRVLLRKTSLGAITAVLVAGAPVHAQDRAIVDASEPNEIDVTVYRDPNRQLGQQLDRQLPRGFAMISETRTVTLPPGESRIRFEGVAEGMVAVSAIVTGLPGGTIEKNRNADLLSPGALVDGTLGNRVTITRTDPASGEVRSEDAIVRTRADGGLVLETEDGFEAVRCSGLPEKLTFDRVPDGLSARPIFSIDTHDDRGGTYTVTLSYLSWGFDWEASYVATLDEGGDQDAVSFDLTSWLTILNDNGQSFDGADLMAVAGRLNVVSDFQRLASPPRATPLRLECYPIGSTATGSPIPRYDDYYDDRMITVTGARFAEAAPPPPPPPPMAPPPPPPPPPPMAAEENLGDLKLYRVPFAVDVKAQSLKQIAFLREEGVKGRLAYEFDCGPWQWSERPPEGARILLETENEKGSGLGVALPTGTVAIFERGPRGELLVADRNLRDYAVGQDVELTIGDSAQVFGQCHGTGGADPRKGGPRGTPMRATLTNANPFPATVRVRLGWPSQWRFEGIETVLDDGQRVVEISVPANGSREFDWRVRPVAD